MSRLRKVAIGLIAGALLFSISTIVWIANYKIVIPKPGVALTLAQIDPELVLAVIAAEDRRFCTHRGFDWVAIHAAIAQAKQGGRLVGASTITQQVAKNVFLWKGRSWARKGLEVWFSFWIEKLWSKARIVEVYLNVAEFRAGQIGIGAALKQMGIGEFHLNIGRINNVMLATLLPNPKIFLEAPSVRVLKRRGELSVLLALPETQTLVSCLKANP
jgi:monofunctional glycosyltransferase